MGKFRLKGIMLRIAFIVVALCSQYMASAGRIHPSRVTADLLQKYTNLMQENPNAQLQPHLLMGLSPYFRNYKEAIRDGLIVDPPHDNFYENRKWYNIPTHFD